MSMGSIIYQTATMASAGTLTSQLNLGGRAWQTVYLKVPTMASNSAVRIHGSSDNSTFQIIKHPPINSATVATNDYTIASTATNTWVPIPNAFRYLKIETTATVDNGAEFVVLCADNA